MSILSRYRGKRGGSALGRVAKKYGKKVRKSTGAVMSKAEEKISASKRRFINGVKSSKVSGKISAPKGKGLTRAQALRKRLMSSTGYMVRRGGSLAKSVAKGAIDKAAKFVGDSNIVSETKGKKSRAQWIKDQKKGSFKNK